MTTTGERSPPSPRRLAWCVPPSTRGTEADSAAWNRRSRSARWPRWSRTREARRARPAQGCRPCSRRPTPRAGGCSPPPGGAPSRPGCSRSPSRRSACPSASLAHHASLPRRTVGAGDSVLSQHDPEKRHRRNDMPDVLYVGLQDDDKIVSFSIDAGAGKLARTGETAAVGAPSAFAVSPDRRVLYVGYRGTPAIESCRMDPSSGALSSLGRVATEHAPTYLATDRTGKYLLSAHYQGAYAAVFPLGSDGAVSGPALDRQNTAPGAHAILTDPSNRFAFVPHIARQNDNVLEPPKNIPGPNFIAQFRFDAATGRLHPNGTLEPKEPIGPRHYCFHPSLDVVYFSDEQGCSVTAYRVDRASGTLSVVETTPSLPAGVTVRNTCSQIYLTPSARFLYVGNRGHNSIAGFAVDPATGHLTPAGHAPTEAVPTAFGLDSRGPFLFAAGPATGRLASYRVDGGTGALTPLETYTVGRRPAAVLAVLLSR